MKKVLYWGILIILVALSLNTPVVRVLSISNRKNPSERIYSTDAVINGFVISYTHSVNKGRIHDYYRVTPNYELEVYKTEFVSYGAGIPEASESAGAEFHSGKNCYSLENLNRRIPELLMAVGVIADHSITVGHSLDTQLGPPNFKEEIFLKDFFKVQTSLVFEARKVSLLKYVTSKKIN